MTSEEAPELPTGYTITDTESRHELHGPNYDNTQRLVNWLPLGRREDLARFARACAAQDAGRGIPGPCVEVVYLPEPEGGWTDEERLQLMRLIRPRPPVRPVAGAGGPAPRGAVAH
jgi:hypothetical protein